MAVPGEREAVPRTEFGVGGHRKALQVAFAAGGPQSKLAILAHEETRGRLQLRTAGGAPLQRRRRQVFHVVEVEVRIDFGIRAPGPRRQAQNGSQRTFPNHRFTPVYCFLMGDAPGFGRPGTSSFSSQPQSSPAFLATF